MEQPFSYAAEDGLDARLSESVFDLIPEAQAETATPILDADAIQTLDDFLIKAADEL